MHAYRRAVARGKVTPILCPHCDDELYPVVGEDLEPELKCFACRSVFDIGLQVWEQIEANLAEGEQ